MEFHPGGGDELFRSAGEDDVSDILDDPRRRHDVIAAARRKIQRKGCDLLVANDVSRSDAGFSADFNAVHLITPDGAVEDVSLRHKAEVASHILDRIEKIRVEREG